MVIPPITLKWIFECIDVWLTHTWLVGWLAVSSYGVCFYRTNLPDTTEWMDYNLINSIIICEFDGMLERNAFCDYKCMSWSIFI